MAAPAPQTRSLFGSIAPSTSQPAASNTTGGLFGQPASSGATGSLFGQAPTTGTSSSLFGQPAPNSNATSSLFGKPATTATSSLFNAPAAASNAASTGGSSLFGNAIQSVPQQSSLFGSTNQSAPQQSSLFGGTNQSAPQQSGGLFASTANATATQPPSSLPAATNNMNTIPQDSNPAPAYYQSLLESNRKRQLDENSFGELPQLQLGLQDISRKVRNLGKGGPSNTRGADARAYYLLSASGVNTSKAIRELEQLAGPAATRSVPTQDHNDHFSPTGLKETLAQTHQMDIQKLVDSQIQRAREEFDNMFNERLPGVDWDAHTQRTYEHMGLKRAQNLDGTAADKSGPSDRSSFGRSSARGKAGGATYGNGSAFGIPGMAKSVIGTPGPRGARASMFADVAEKIPIDGMRLASEDGVLRRKQDKYAERVKDLNIARIQQKPYPILTRFSEVEAEPTNEDTTMLVNAFKALVHITGEDPSKENLSEPGAIKERHYAQDYLDDTPNARGHIAIRKRIIQGSRTFLETLFHNQLEGVVAKNPREANIGGVPTVLAKVKGYVRVRAVRKELGPDLELLQEVNGDYCWPLVFYLLRSGLYNEALQYVEENAAAFRQIDRQFMRYLRAYVTSEDHRLPPEFATSISNEYSQRQRLAPEDSIDPYRMMCYKVVGRCDLAKRSLDNITNDMMDWIWLQFVLAREYSRVDEYAHEAFGLDDVRQSIKEVGERYFGLGSEIANAPNTLFFMQVLAGMFEKGVADLYPHNYLSATHFAIALDFYGLFRVANISNSDDLLSYTTRQQPQIAFGSMVGLYTRDFRTANATAAVDYIALICLNADLTGQVGKTQRELCYQALTEVVLETREFAQLLGDIRADGQRIKGAIEQRLKLIGLDNEQAFLKHITLVAAKTAHEQSRTTDAALLFHLAEDYNKVIEVVNNAVSLVLTTEIGVQPARLTPLRRRDVESQNNQSASEQQASLSLTATDDPVQLARDMKQLYEQHSMYNQHIEPRMLQSTNVLLILANARNALEKADWSGVVDLVTTSGVLPTNFDGNLSAIRSKAQEFALFPESIARTIGHVMIWTVVGLSNQADRLRSEGPNTGARAQTRSRCVQTFEDVKEFAGLIPYNLPDRVWETFARAAQELGAY